MHSWQNIDTKGTIGWHRCSICGLRRHFAKSPPESPDMGFYEGCEERNAHLLPKLADAVTALLHKHDADTDTIRALLAKAIRKHKADSPYTRKSSG